MRIDQFKQIAGKTAQFDLPATDEEIKQCQEDLYILDLPPIPQEYVDFLRQCNGFSDGGDQCFFGTETELTKKYKQGHIVSANQYEFHMDFFIREKKLHIGTGGEDLFVYNAVNGCYEVLDETGLDVYKSFETFEELFRYVNKRW